MVEFQQSSWSKGSYLNVGACFLWNEKDFLSFDAGHRVEGFHEFISDAQFALAATFLAERAGQEVLALRERFASPSHVEAWMAANAGLSLWGHYHAAVAARSLPMRTTCRGRSTSSTDARRFSAVCRTALNSKQKSPA